MCEKPESLPCRDEGEACQVVVHEWRLRTTGPGHPLMVVYCKTHGLHFTVYPRGYVPYGRQRMVPRCREEHKSPTGWEGTVFAPVVTDSWLGDYSYTGGPSWQTGRRRLRYCGRLLGLVGEERVGEAVAALLEVPLSVQVEARRRFASGLVGDERAALRSVLEAVAVTPRLWRQLMRVGRATGVWGDAWEWRQGVLVPLFPLAEAASGKAPGKRLRATRELTK